MWWYQSGFMKEKWRSLQFLVSLVFDFSFWLVYKVVCCYCSIYEVDIFNLEVVLWVEEFGGYVYEIFWEEIVWFCKMELEFQYYDVDINKEFFILDKVFIFEWYIDLEFDIFLSFEELKEKQKKVERIKIFIVKFSMQNVVFIGEGDFVDVFQDLESQLQEQEKWIEIFCVLVIEVFCRGCMLFV